jgi:phage-related protein
MKKEKEKRVTYDKLQTEIRAQGYSPVQFWRYVGQYGTNDGYKQWAMWSVTEEKREYIIDKFYEYISIKKPNFTAPYHKNRIRKTLTLEQAVEKYYKYLNFNEETTIRDIYRPGYRQRNFEKLNAWVNEYNSMQKNTFKIANNF